MEEKKFLDEVLGHIPRATWREKREIRAELAGHLEDHALDLEERGCTAEEAREQAVKAMGDPGEIGEALNAQLSDFWLNIQVVAQAATAILLILMLRQLDWQEPIRLIRENKMVRQGPVAWATYGEDAYLRWDSGEEMQVGDSIVRLEGAEVMTYANSAQGYRCQLSLCTYQKQAWKPARYEIFYHIQVIPGGVEDVEIGAWNYESGGGCCVVRYEFYSLTPADITYVDVVYDYLGEHVEMRCQVEWEEQVWDGEKD